MQIVKATPEKWHSMMTKLIDTGHSGAVASLAEGRAHIEFDGVKYCRPDGMLTRAIEAPTQAPTSAPTRPEPTADQKLAAERAAVAYSLYGMNDNECDLTVEAMKHANGKDL